jgi:precorrin-2 dehydrogenase / sirohydrochlorin ferrochelatase
MKLYPVMLNISGKKVLVIGGGNVAARKVRDLVECGALVTVVSPSVDASITELMNSCPGKIEIVQRAYMKDDLVEALMVFSATDDEEVNRRVYRDAGELNIFINAVDDPPNCTFFVPSWFDRGGLVISVSTGGISPSMAARIRREIEKIIPDGIEETLAALQQSRALLREDDEFQNLSSDTRGKILKQIVLDDELLNELIVNYKNDTVKNFVKKILSHES